MKYFFLLVALCLVTKLFSQENDTAYLYRQAIESQIDYENKDNKFSSMNIVFLERRFEELTLFHEGVSLNNLQKEELKNKSKKGIDIIEVYPIKVVGDKIEITTMSIFRKRKKISVYGKSTFFFKYDCEKKKYIMFDKNQNML